MPATRGKKAGAKVTAARKVRAPVIIGDSTMILATPYLGRSGIEADARGCRQMSAGIRHLVRVGTLRRIAGWRAYDFLRSGHRPWTDIYVRRDRKVIVASRRP